MKKLKVGFAPTRRFVFSKEDAFKYKNLIKEKISGYDEIEIIDLEDINDEGLLFDNDFETKKIIKKFREAEVDAVFFPHTNFGTEDTVSRVAKALRKPVLLWGPRDEDPLEDGMRLRDTQCGLFATGKVLRRFNVPYTYIINSRVDSEVFDRGFKNFIAVANVVKEFNSLRILQIAPRPAGFWTMICNEGELLEKFGIETYPITIQEFKDRIIKEESTDSTQLLETIELIKNKIDCSATTEKSLRRVAAVKVAMRNLADEHMCSAIAIQCWNSLQDATEVMPCLANALLTDEGLPVVCETDIHGAITSVMAKAATFNRQVPFFADLTVRHSENENSELLFHCGNFPLSLSKCDDGCKPKFNNHFLFDSHAPGTLEGEIVGGDMTIVRFDGDHGNYQLFLGKAKGVEGKFTRGSYVWVEVENWPRWEEKLVTGPYVHHCVGIHADIVPVLYEACKYINGLTPDFADNNEEEVKAWLRGE